jgi:signal transduction histidine kinase
MAYHELRSPLALVATAARSAASDCDDDEIRARCLTIVRAAERMLRTAGHLMNVADASRGGYESDFDPAPVIQRLVEDFGGLRVRIESQLIAPDSALVRGDVRRFEALICSLLNNAYDHGAVGQPIVIKTVHQVETLMISVTNTIDPLRNHRGLGLGTYIVERLAGELGAVAMTERRGDQFNATLWVSVTKASRALGLEDVAEAANGSEERCVPA